MADVIVSPLVKLVKQQVIDCLNYQYELHSGVEGKLNNLADVLNRIEAVANTADELDLEEHKSLKAWMKELKVAAEEATDVVDEFEYLCLEHQAEGDGAGDELRFCPPSLACLKSFTQSQRGFFHSLFMYVERFFQFTKPLESLNNIQRKLDALASSAGQFLQLVADRKATDHEHHSHRQDSRKWETCSSMIEAELVGRHVELEEIINKLLEDEQVVSDDIPVVPVFGHGGMGKTTLTQHVFNDIKVTSHFDVRMWAYVSEDFHLPDLTRKMIESADPQETCSDTDSLEALQRKLKGALKSKKFLIVLDELWYGRNMTETEMMRQWDYLFRPLKQVGRKGSKILVTSPTPKVEKLPGALTPMISLQGLKPDEFWSIIQRRAFPNHQNSQHLAAIGEKIALKLHGWPLAAKMVGSTLKYKLDVSQWSTFLNKKLPMVKENEWMPVLKMHYQQLAPHLRKCFIYCSLFPKGHEFDVDMLIRMWMAHGYIDVSPETGITESEEDMGRSYLNDLLSAGVFTTYQKVDGYPSKVFMHELMNDLATSISKDEFLRIIEEDALPQDGNIPATVRHLSVRSDYLAKLNKKNLSNLQTLIVFPSYGDLDGNLVREVLTQLRRVRVLDLHGCKVKELPDHISARWVHLRYLDLSYTQICRLPEWLCRLYHLQLLNIPPTDSDSDSSSLGKLNHLVNLRFVGSDIDLKLTWVRGLESLQVLRANLLLERGSGSDIESLDALNKLRESLFLKGLNYVQSGAEARAADLCGKKELESLFMTWVEDDSSSPCSPAVAADVLEGLQPQPNLNHLNIYNYPGTRSPDWMGAKYLRLNKLEITRCRELRALPILSPTITQVKFENVGIYSLPSFHDDHAEIGSSSSNGAAPKLSKLFIEDCDNLTSLDKGLLRNQHRLSHLEEVIIRSCEKLETLPAVGFRELRALKILQVGGCPNLTWVIPNQDVVDRSLLPSSLKELTISHMGDDAVSRCLHGITSLSKLKISNSPSLKSLPSQEELACLSSSLQELLIIDCEALIPSGLDGLLALASLKLLRIEECPKLHSTADDSEDIGTGPISVAVERLVIDNPLMLIKVPVLKSLSSVQQVHIKDASGLISFSPELEAWLLQNGNSLWRLKIHKARKLLSLPDLPKSLEELVILNARTEFKGKYEKDGDDWNKIQHIEHREIFCD